MRISMMKIWRNLDGSPKNKFRLAVKDLLYAPFHRQESEIASCEVMAETIISLMGPPSWIDPTTYRTMSGHSSTELDPAPK